MVISVYPETETHLCLTIIGIITFKKKKIAKILDQIFTSWQSKPDSVSTDTDEEIIEIRQVSNHYSPKDIFNLDKCWFFFFFEKNSLMGDKMLDQYLGTRRKAYKLLFTYAWTVVSLKSFLYGLSVLLKDHNFNFRWLEPMLRIWVAVWRENKMAVIIFKQWHFNMMINYGNSNDPVAWIAISKAI